VDITLSIYRNAGVHKLTVVARPHKANLLGEYVLIEAFPLDAPDDPALGAPELLARAYDAVNAQLAGRGQKG
jgi:hypothetical protein